MKKKITVLIIFVLLFVVGCGNNLSELNVDDTQNIIEADLKNMQIVNDDTLRDVYGLSLDLMEIHIVKQNTIGDMYAIIKTNEKVKVKNEMSKYFDKIQKFNSNYSPERLEILNNRIEKEIGDYLIYIVAEDGEKIYSNIIDSL